MDKGIIFREVHRFSLRFRWLLVLLMLGAVGGVFAVIANISRSSANLPATKKGPFNGGPVGAERKPGKEDYLRNALRLKARVHMAYGDYAKAQPLVEQALTSARTNNACDSELSSCLLDVAWLYRHQGKLADAKKMCKQGLKLQEKLYSKNHPNMAYTLRVLGSIYQAQGKYRRARRVLNRALAIMQNNYMEDDPIIGPFKVDIARLLAAQGDLGEAEAYYLPALSLVNKSHGPGHLYTAGVIGSIARLYTLQERYVEAQPLIKRTLAIQEKVYGPDHHLLAPAWLTMAKICQAKKDNTQAEKLINKAREAAEKTGNPLSIAQLDEHAAMINSYR
jgi:tetratricopeptide (TPR) repeat protein